MKKIILLICLLLSVFACSKKSTSRLACAGNGMTIYFVGEKPLKEVYATASYSPEKMASYGFTITDKASFDQQYEAMKAFFVDPDGEVTITWNDGNVDIRQDLSVEIVTAIGTGGDPATATYEIIAELAKIDGVDCVIEKGD
ncbi:MAG: hypothetical protein LBR25_04245 [Erysipelotrichaceae bacterium]|jgi:hypothetical protein|nr:hypothetical protein [Erysipelotrichaceae bacterium]